MSMGKNKNVMSRLVNLTVILLFTFVFVSVASAGNNPEFVNITINDTESIIFANHSDSITDGNWISLSGGDPIQLPSPFTLTYNGINSSTSTNNGKTINIAVDVDNYSDYVITYPYVTHDMFTDVSGKNNVSMSFNGSTYFANNGIDVYLIETGVTSLKDAFNDITNGDTTSFRNLLDNAYLKEFNTALDGSGDVKLNFGAVSAGDYVIFTLLNSSHLSDLNDMSILSATTFQVLEYESTITAQSIVTLGDTFYVGIELTNAPSETYTYGAVLIHESAYRAEMQLKFDGTRAGTNLTLNGADIIQGYEIAGIGLSNLNKTTIQNIINDGIGSNNGSVTLKTASTNSTSIPLVTSQLRTGNYILLTGVYKSGEMLVAFDQTDVLIKTPVSSSGRSGTYPTTTTTTTETEITETTVTETQSVSNVADGATLPVSFTKTDVTDIEITVKNAASNVEVTVEKLLTKPSSIPDVLSQVEDSPGMFSTGSKLKIFGYLSMDVNIDDGNIDNAKVAFKVDKSWFSKNNIGKSTVKLTRYHDSWDALPTELSDEDDDYVYYVATTPGFSTFAIVGEELTVATDTTPSTETDDVDGPASETDDVDEPVSETDDVPDDGDEGLSGLILTTGLIGILALGGLVLKRKDIAEWIDQRRY